MALLEYPTVLVLGCALAAALVLLWNRAGRGVDRPHMLIFIGALLLRYASATWGPGDLGMNLASIFVDATAHSGYGDAPFPLLNLVFTFLPPNDRTLIVVSMIIGSLAVPAIGAFLEGSGCGRRTALAGTILLATMPLMIRFSGEGERQAYVIFFACAALAGLARCASTASRDTLPRIVYVTAAVLCARSRPEAILLLPIAFLYSAFRRDWAPATWIAHLVAATLAIVLLFLPALSGAGNSVAYSTLHLPEGLAELIELGVVFDRSYTPFAFLAAFAWGIWARDKSREQMDLLRWGLAALALLLLAYGDLRQTAAALRISSARYQTLSMIPFTTVAAIGIERLSARINGLQPVPARFLAFGAVAAILSFSWWRPYHDVGARRTVDVEYAFIREALPLLPANAVIYYVSQTDTLGHQLDTGLRTPTFLSQALGLPHHSWVAWQPGRDGEAEVTHANPENYERPQFYYQAAGCSEMPDPGVKSRARPMFELCRLALAAHGKTPFHAGSLASQPFAADLYYPDPAPVGFYRITR